MGSGVGWGGLGVSRGEVDGVWCWSYPSNPEVKNEWSCTSAPPPPKKVLIAWTTITFTSLEECEDGHSKNYAVLMCCGCCMNRGLAVRHIRQSDAFPHNDLHISNGINHTQMSRPSWKRLIHFLDVIHSRAIDMRYTLPATINSRNTSEILLTGTVCWQ